MFESEKIHSACIFKNTDDEGRSLTRILYLNQLWTQSTNDRLRGDHCKTTNAAEQNHRWMPEIKMFQTKWNFRNACSKKSSRKKSYSDFECKSALDLIRKRQTSTWPFLADICSGVEPSLNVRNQNVSNEINLSTCNYKNMNKEEVVPGLWMYISFGLNQITTNFKFVLPSR